MDIQDIAKQLVSAATDNPELLQGLMSDPHKTVKKATGHHVEGADLGDLLQVAGPLLSGKGGIDLDGIAELASGLLGNDDDDDKDKKRKKDDEGDLGDLVEGALGVLGGLLGK